jgi:small subunit ribosomal protein S8
MSTQDPIADMLTRIRNGQLAKHASVVMQSSSIKLAIAQVLKDEGFINDYRISDESAVKKTLEISLKYYNGEAVISKLKRVSRPGLRKYIGADDITDIPGFGIAILSTSRGVISHKMAKKENVGGEVIAEVA